MKVLLNDGLEKEGLKIFQEAGIETDTKKKRFSRSGRRGWTVRRVSRA